MDTYFKQLAGLYHNMDNTWNQVAAKHHFQCNGCRDNCCLSLFFHHTHIERAYLLYGFNTLTKDAQQAILKKAKHYYTATFDSGGIAVSKSKKIPCPLLMDGRCGLYQFRPMICRMHGLPHELHRPGFGPLKGPGCDAGNFEGNKDLRFDRTPFYREMAGIEMKFRTKTGLKGKIKQTIAEILLTPKIAATPQSQYIT